MSKKYRLFISHSWKHSKDYDKIIQLLKEKDLGYFNHSVDKDKPIDVNGDDKNLENALDAKIKSVSCVLVLAGVYASYSEWINKEIEIANKYEKPIIAIELWGAEKTSTVVKDSATKIVKWQGSSIVDAIKTVVIEREESELLKRELKEWEKELKEWEKELKEWEKEFKELKIS